MRTWWIVVPLFALAGCISSLRDLETKSVDKTPRDSPVFEQPPNVMVDTCQSVLESEDYKVTKVDRKAGVVVGEQIQAGSLDQEGTRTEVTLTLQHKDKGSIVHICAVKEINKNIEDPQDMKKAKWSQDDRASDSEAKILFKLQHRLSDDAKDVADDYMKRHENVSPMAKQMTKTLDTDDWDESCPFHCSLDAAWAAMRQSLSGCRVLGEDMKSKRMETEWDVQPGVDGHFVRKKTILQLVPTGYEVVVKVQTRWEITSDIVKDKTGDGARWESIGNDEETQRQILLKLTMQLKG